MPKLHLTFAKIVATPSDETWSQAYHAGTLGALISLKKTSPREKKEAKTREALHSLGKELVSTLESEYFTLPTKNLAAIKETFETVIKKIPQDVTPSLALASVSERILYIFGLGEVSFLLKRGDKLGTLLINDKQEIVSASGPLEQNDIIILQTHAFGDIVPTTSFGSLAPSSLPDTAERLSPSVHKSGRPDAAAVFFSYHMQETSPLIMPATPSPEMTRETAPEEPIAATKTKINAPVAPAISRARRIYSFSHMQKILVTVGVLLIIMLIVGVYFSLKNRQDQKTHALFQSLYPPAEKKYEEGQNLLDLNANLAEGDFIKAQTMLQDSQNKFPAGSNEAKQIAALLAKVNDALKNIDAQNSSSLSEADKSNTPLLATETQNMSAKYFTQDDKNIYFIDDKGVDAVDKTTNKVKQIITNNNTWSEPAGLGVYYGNIYVADKKDGIDKFVSSGSGFSKMNYFADGVNADLSKGQAIAIDSSIYVLSNDGSIAKFTRGKPDSFSVGGLDKPFNDPTRIFTDADATNIYILDNGNGRIVTLNKSGQYQQQYAAGQLKQSSDFDVQEKNKVIYVLSEGKIWKVDLK